MASPMNCPSALTVTYCLALPGPKPANVLTPKSDSSRSASGPLRYRSVMWWDWSNSAQEVRQARCSERQLVNSGATGNKCGRALELRSSSTGDPACAIAASRLDCGITCSPLPGRDPAVRTERYRRRSRPPTGTAQRQPTGNQGATSN